jgi:hypothetical protein
LQFVLKRSNTNLGQSIAIVGSHPLLGSWNPQKALMMRTSAQSYPRWTSDVLVFKKRDLYEK